jgi:hypothetical protein
MQIGEQRHRWERPQVAISRKKRELRPLPRVGACFRALNRVSTVDAMVPWTELVFRVRKSTRNMWS